MKAIGMERRRRPGPPWWPWALAAGMLAVTIGFFPPWPSATLSSPGGAIAPLGDTPLVTATVSVMNPAPPVVAAAVAPVPEPTDEPAADAITLAFVGDIQLAGVPAEFLTGTAPAGFAAALAPLREADLAFANLECPISRRGSAAVKQFTFAADPARTATLTRFGIDAVTVANNHVLDFGPLALADTLDALDAAGIARAGAGRSAEEARRPVLLTARGITIAFLGRSSIMPQSLPGTGCQVAALNETALREDVAAARAQADLVVVAAHWGVEREEVADGLQRRFAAAALAAGADIVCGHHPHRLMGVQRTARGVVAYSLGNFLFGNSGRSFHDTAMLVVTAGKDGVRSARMVPLIDRPEPGNCWLPLVAPADAAARILLNLNRLSRAFATAVNADGSVLAFTGSASPR